MENVNMQNTHPVGQAQEKVPFNVFQKELLLACQTSLSDYSETSTRGFFRIAKNLSVETLREAIHLILRHMPLLGATLGLDGDEPCFVFGAPRDIDLRSLDLRGDPDPHAAASRYADSFLDEPVDEQFVRYAVLRTDESECVFLFKCSHLALDGLGYFFHVSLLAEVYTALLRGERPDLGEPCSLREQYEADEAYRTSPRAEKDLAFWREHLQRLPERRIFRALPGRPDVLGDSRHRKFVLSEEASRLIAQILEQRGIGPAAYFTAVHALIVAHMCDEQDLVIQTPIAFGERKSISKRQGVRMATPSLHLEMRNYETLAQLLEATARQSADFFRHVRTPFQLAMRKLPGRQLPNIADTFINYLPGRPLGTPDFPIVWIDQDHSEKEPVLLGALVMEDCLTKRYVLLVRTSRNHLTERDVERYVARIEHLSRQLAAGAELPELDYLLKEERRELERFEPGPRRDYPVASMPALFDATAERFPGREAVRDESGATLTYAQLRENSLRCASRLMARGVRKGDIVAVLARRTLHLPEMVLGVQRLGAVYLPVDPDAPAERIAFILEDAGAVATMDSASPEHAGAPLAELPAGPAASDAAYLIYTSGSTGRPKGVLAPHAGFVNMIQGQMEAFGIGPEDRVLLFAPPVFDASLSEMFMALFAGACLLPVSDALRNAPWELKRHMERNAVSVVTFPPSYLRLFEREPFAGLRVLITAGEPPVADDALHYAGELRYFNAYGPTEACVCASMKRVTPQDEPPISSGRPIPNAVARIVDRQGRPRPAGMVGELWVGGASVALGYHGNQELTAARFRSMPGMEGVRGYATGDQALWSETGEIVLVGRADDQVKIRGNRVELGEVAFLLESCPQVRQAAVLAVKDHAGQNMLAAFLLPTPGAALEDVAAWSRRSLPAYMVPSLWRMLESMPVTRTGKVDRAALKVLAQKPETPVEKGRSLDPRLLAVFERVLGHPCEPGRNFFDQGGNSLLAMSLLHEIRKVYNVDVAFRDFAGCDCLFDLGALLHGRTRTDAASPCDTAPLSRGQFRIWAYQQVKTGTIDYNMPLLLEAEGDGADRFVAALRDSMEEQDLLTCAVAGDIDAPHFLRRPGTRVPLTQAQFPDEATALAHFDALIHAPFDLRGEAPARIAAAKVGNRVQVLVLVHHLVADGESLELVVRNALERMEGGKPSRGGLAVQAQFCRREQEYLRSEAAREDARFWRRMLTPALAPLNAAAPLARKGAMAALALPLTVAEGLERQARASGATVLTCFAALLARFLCRRYDREEMLLGVPVGLRETGEEFRAAGFFVSTVALRLPADADAATAARQMRECLAHSRHVLEGPAPDFLATHAHAEPLTAPGFTLRRLSPRLRACKFTGSFLLQTGPTPCLVLEHDATFIPDGEGVLHDLLRHMEASLPVLEESAAPQNPRDVLAGAWAAVLRVAPEQCDDFFRAGGDSIKAIQITGMLHRSGVTALDAPDFLATPGFADLCGRVARPAGRAESRPAEVLPPGTRVPLLPVQRALLRDHPLHWKTFHMLLPLQLGPAVPTSGVEAWVRALPERFQALGLAFSPEGALVLERRQQPNLERRSFPAETPRADVLRAMARELAPVVDPEAGRTLAAGLAARGAERILVLLGHHLVLDVVSLAILQEDLPRFLRGEPSGEGCGLASRALEVQRLADAGEFPAPGQEAFWESVCAAPASGLSALRTEGVAPGLTTTRVRLDGFRADLSPSVVADLLSALAVAMGRAGQRQGVFVSLKSHGRDGLLSGRDLSRSLGWFTALCPMPLAPASSCAEAAESIGPFIREAFTPLACNSFGYLRLRHGDRFGVRPQVGFNYLGVLAAEEAGDVVPLLSQAAPGDIAELLHPDFEPDCALDLSAWIDGTGALFLLAYHNPRALPETWITGLLEAWAAAVRTLPCFRPPLEEDVLDAIRAACGCEDAELERIAEPLATQEPMLYQRLAADDGVYVQQIAFRFGGRLDEFLLMRAWTAVIGRHESLRSLFPMPRPGEFHRVVLRRARATAEYHDLSHLPGEAARAEADALQRRRREEGFDLDRGPLLRALVLRLDADTLVLGWCFHHLLMDGWCIGVLLEELFATYAALDGRAAASPPVPFPLVEYERWRARFDTGAAKAHWKALLQGFDAPTRVAPADGPRGGEPQTVEHSLDAALTAALASAAIAHAATLSALLQAMWAMVLGAENGGRRDVLYGVVVSGRPAELSGVDRAVGLFIQTLPLRVRWSPDTALAALLAELKAQSLGQMRHGYLPLAEAGGKSIDHLLVFENYPFRSPFGEEGPRLLEVSGYEKLPYPLGITVIPGERLGLRFLYDSAAMGRERAASLLRRLVAALCAVAANPALCCRELEEAVRSVAEVPAGTPPPAMAAPSTAAAAPARAAAPIDDMTETVRAIYADVLGRPVPTGDEDFHLLGGHSLSAMRVLAQISKQLGIQASIGDVLGCPTPRMLAERLRELSGPSGASGTEIARVAPEGVHPLSPSQRRIWFLQRLHGDNVVHQIPFAARLRGELDVAAFQRALLLVESRHDALRLRVDAERPEQRLAPAGGLRLELHQGPCPELAHGTPPMPLGLDAPLVRVALYRQAADDVVLFLSVHHIVFDGWSSQVFLRDLHRAYAATLRGEEPGWPGLALDFLSYASWENSSEPAGLEALRDSLLPLPERLRLPLDLPRSAAGGLMGGVRRMRLTREQGQGLKALAGAAGTTLFPVLAALVAVLLRGHTGQNDMILGCPAANRELPQTQGMVGLLVNTLVLRVGIDPDGDFKSLVRAADAALSLALAAQAVPFERLVEAVGVERDPARNPLFDVFVALEDAEWAVPDLPLLRMEPLPLPHHRSKFDMSFYFREVEPDLFEIHLEYAAELFLERTAEAVCARLATLVDSCLRADAEPVASLQLLPQEELELLRGFNETSEPLDIEGGADGLFAAQARKTPGAPAVVEPSGRVCPYAELDAMVSALAGLLAERGVRRGDPVAVCHERSLTMIASIFATLRLGAVYVPLAPNLPQSRLRMMLEDLGDAVVLCPPAMASRLAACGLRPFSPDAAQPHAPADPLPGPGPDDVAYIIFTSGSTGRPKGAQLEHRALRNRILWMQSRFPIGPGDVILQKTIVTFDVSLWELLWWSWQGAALALLEPGAEGDPARIVQAVHAHKVTVIHFVPSMLRLLLDHIEAHPEDAARLSTLRYVFTSGEALPRELVARFNEMLSAQLHNLYGPTEAAIDVSWQSCVETPPRAVPIGRPVANTKLHVLDDRQRPVPVGVAGEIWISGVQVALGYVNRPELTARCFRADPAAPGGRLYRTGDLGRWLPEGVIEYLGRNDDQVKVRGHRIELGEVEAALGRCAGVAQAVVRVCRIGGVDALEAFLLPRPGHVFTLRGLRAGLAEMLPEYMTPSLFHVVDHIPLSSSGKADRRAVSGVPLGAGAPGDGACARPDPAVDGGIEEVRQVWRQVMPEADVRDADLGFFEAGGNSLLLVQLHTLLEKRWPGMFTLGGLFSENTIRAQAGLLARAGGETAAPGRAAGAVGGPVAIIGMAVRIADYDDTESFWADLAAGADKNVPLSDQRREEVRQIFEAVGYPFDAGRLREAAYLSDISGFDCKRFGMSPGDASLLDPRHRVFLETALRALDDAGYGGAALEGADVGVFVGASPYRLFQDAVSRCFPEQAEQIYLLNVPSNMMARLSHLKNWRGPAALVDTACSSVLKAVHDACASLRQGECSVALVGGAHIIDLPVKGDQTFTIEAASGRTRTFDAAADGVGAGEGAAVFVLKPLELALRDNDAIHAVIAGSAVNQDGRASSMAAPNPVAQGEVIARAAANAGVSLADFSCFEAHGTGTVLGDPVEIEGLGRAFAAMGVHPERKALIGSVKGNLGHLDAAAGAVGLAKAVLCLEKGLVPPQPHFTRPNPHIDFDAAPVRVADALSPLDEDRRPWLCGVSAFGLSGVNTHIVVAGHTPAAPPAEDGVWFCVPLSARDEEGLRRYRLRLRQALLHDEGLALHAVAATLAAGREHLDARTAMVAGTRQELLDALARDGVCVRVGRNAAPDAPRVVGVACATREEAEAAARAFLEGATPVWPADRPARRAHLPATPFARARLWPRFPERFLSAPVPSPSGEVREIGLCRPEFWPAAQHILAGTPTLVGMALPNLLADMAGGAPLLISDLRWLRPVTAEPGSRAVLLARANGPGQAVELHHFDGGGWTLAASAEVRPLDSPPSAALDMAAQREGLLPAEAQGPEAAVRVSGRWRCREEFLVSPDGGRLLARLSLPEAHRGDLHSFRWHPALLDVAASLALHGAGAYIPARCGAVRLHRPLPAAVHALATISDRRPGRITAHCVVTDLSGNILAELDGLVFLAPAGARAQGLGPGRPELFAERWTPAAPLQPAAPNGTEFLLLGATAGPLGRALARRARLCRSLPVTQPEIRALVAELGGISHVVVLPEPGDVPWIFCDLLREVLRARPGVPLRVTAVVPGGALRAAGAPELALPLGPLLCLPMEEPRVSCACVELADPTPEALRALLDHLDRFDGPCLVDSHGALLTRGFARFAEADETCAATLPALSPGACAVITGGLGGMGLTLARQLTEAGSRVVLLHRRERAPEGLPFAALRCDVTDAAAVEAAFAAIRRDIGPVEGVIHAAGEPGRGYLATKTREVYESVLAPKVAGTWNVHNATLADPLRFFVLASSRTSLTGGAGQSDYTAANAFLNAFARHRQRLGLPALALCWNTWSGVGMAARLGADKGAFALGPDQAGGVLAAALRGGAALAAVAMPGEAEAWGGSAPEAGHDPALLGAAAAGGTDEAEAASAAALSALDGTPASLEAQLIEIIRDCLGYETPPTREDDFFELGGDSIAATRIISRMDQSLGIKTGVMDLLEADTLGGFIDKALAARSCTASAAVPSSGSAPERESYPVGREQLSILYADMLGADGLGFNLPAFLKMPPDLDLERLEAALAELLRRHEVLRTTFRDFEAERPNMVILPFAGFRLKTVRLPDLSRKDDLITPFDLKREGGFRVKLLLPDDGAPVLFYDIHHALADGRTISLLNTELYRLYHGLPLPPVGAQMKDLAWRQLARDTAADREYWLARFQGALPRLDLPAEYPRPKVFTNRGGMHEFELPKHMVADLKALARREGMTNYHVVLAAWSLLAHAYTGRRDLVIAVSVDSRGENLNTAGMLASLLPLRLTVDGAKPLAELLRDTRTASNEALRHSGYILHDLLADLRPPACPDRSPLSEIILSYMNFEFASDGEESPLFEPLRFGKNASKTDLSIFASDTGEGISFALEYYADLFSPADIAAMAEDFTRILALMTQGGGDAPVPFVAAPRARRDVRSASRRLEAGLVRGLDLLARRLGVGRDAVLLATFAALLSRAAGLHDFAVDAVGRGAVDFSIGEDTEFEALLAHAEAALRGDGGGLPAGAGPRDEGLRAAFVWEAGPEDALAATHDLLCSARTHEDGVLLRFEHDAGALPAQTATAWLGHYVRFLEGVAKADA
jgi:amino acid adenylation domain-containing protein